MCNRADYLCALTLSCYETVQELLGEDAGRIAYAGLSGVCLLAQVVMFGAIP
jgi:hypothetical protein